MAWWKVVSAVTVLSFFFFLWGGGRVTAISTEELDGVLMILRAQGHVLFANAISTSDMLFDVLSARSLTLLAPTDPTVFALDMTNTPPSYISTLRLHALPLRLSWSQLRLLSNGSLLPTLLPSRQLRVLRRQQVNTLVVDGVAVEVVMPGLYYSRDVAVHALGGILTLRSKIPTDNTSTDNNTFFFPPPPVPRLNNNRTSPFFPTVNNRTHFFPPRLPRIPIINNTTSNRTLFFPPPLPRIPVDNTTTSNRTLPPLPRIPIINHTNPTHSLVYAPSPAPNRQMGEVLAGGDMCAMGWRLRIWTHSHECVGE